MVKFALEQGGFKAELRALKRLAPTKLPPSIIAQGSTSSSIPFVVITYHGEPLCEFDHHIVFVDVSRLYFLFWLTARSHSSLLWHDIIKPMHSGGYHHHDIKPDNVTKDAKGKLHLIDFNLAVPIAECSGYCPDMAFLETWGLANTMVP